MVIRVIGIIMHALLLVCWVGLGIHILAEGEASPKYWYVITNIILSVYWIALLSINIHRWKKTGKWRK